MLFGLFHRRGGINPFQQERLQRQVVDVTIAVRLLLSREMRQGGVGARDAGLHVEEAHQISRRGGTRRLGFTLIELVVVIAVIAILATLVAPNVLRHVSSARDTTARSQIEMLGAALDAYRLDNARYPTSAQGLGALWEAPSGEPRPVNWRGPYLRKPVPLDPWSRPYVYVSPGRANPTGYDLSSLGADGQPGGTGDDADVNSWQ